MKQNEQTTMGIFLKNVTFPQEESQLGLLGGAPGEGAVIIGNDCFTHVTPEDLPVRQDVKKEGSDIVVLALCRPRLMCVFVF